MMAQMIVNRAFRLDHIASSVASCRCWILAQAVGIAIGRRIRSRCCRAQPRGCNAMRFRCNPIARGEAWAYGADCTRVFAGQRGGSIALKRLAPALVGRRWRDEAFAPHYASK